MTDTIKETYDRAQYYYAKYLEAMHTMQTLMEMEIGNLIIEGGPNPELLKKMNEHQVYKIIIPTP